MTAGTRRASAKDGENGVPINVSILTPGLYVVAFRNSKGVVVRKFVKL